MAVDDIHFNVVPYELVAEKDYMLTEGDIVYIGSWEQLSVVASNLHDDRREDVEDREKYLTPTFVECLHDYGAEAEEELCGFWVGVVSFAENRNQFSSQQQAFTKALAETSYTFPEPESEETE